MIRSILAFATAAALVVAMAAVAVAAGPNHGADVSAVANAVHTTQGNAHGKAVSAIASAHGKAISAAARAHAAANKAAGQANGAAGKANGQANKANGARPTRQRVPGGPSEAPDDDAPAEPGRVKDNTSGS